MNLVFGIKNYCYIELSYFTAVRSGLKCGTSSLISRWSSSLRFRSDCICTRILVSKFVFNPTISSSKWKPAIEKKASDASKASTNDRENEVCAFDRV